MNLVLAAVGDVLIDRAEPATVLVELAPLLQACDVVFGNFEGVISDRPADPAVASTVVDPGNAEPLAVFTVLSLANNHAFDAGASGLADTIKALSERDIGTVGAGETITTARTPLVVERADTRIAFVAATSVLPISSDATPTRAGVAPLRADDYFTPRSRVASLPGVPPRVVSVLDDADRAALVAAVGTAKADAEIVVVSVHWGDHTQPWTLTEHERRCARIAIDAGADIVFGHHQHFFRGVEFISGRPVFYGLGHIVFDQPRYIDELRARAIDIDTASERQLIARFGEYGVYPRSENPAFPFHPLARKTGIAILEIAVGDIIRTGIAPAVIGSDGVPRPLRREDGNWDGAIAFFRACVDKVGLPTEIADRGWTYAGYDVLDVFVATQ